jgi:hypothetical protein
MNPRKKGASPVNEACKRSATTCGESGLVRVNLDHMMKLILLGCSTDLHKNVRARLAKDLSDGPFTERDSNLGRALFKGRKV